MSLLSVQKLMKLLRVNPNTTINIAVTTAHQPLITDAQNLANQMALPYVTDQVKNYNLVLELTKDGIVLFEPHSKSRLYLDYCAGAMAYRLRQLSKNKKQPLVRAIGLQGDRVLTVLDLTAGWGRDALILASLGCHMHLIERSVIVVALLDDALQRLQASLSDPLAIQLTTYDAKDYLIQLTAAHYPDVIYLDPMYPRRNKSALVKKEMRFLRQLVGDDTDADELLILSLTRANKRVVVKRPKGAPVLAGMEPNTVIKSPNTRYDIYFP